MINIKPIKFLSELIEPHIFQLILGFSTMRSDLLLKDSQVKAGIDLLVSHYRLLNARINDHQELSQ